MVKKNNTQCGKWCPGTGVANRHDILYASNASLDVAFLEAPHEPVLLDEMSLDFSIISEDETDGANTSTQSCATVTANKCSALNNVIKYHDTPSLVVDNDYFSYYPVHYHQWTAPSFIFQVMVLSNFGYIYRANHHSLVYTLSLDSMINIMCFVSNSYWHSLRSIFYRETMMVKLIYLAMIYPFIMTMSFLIQNGANKFGLPIEEQYIISGQNGLLLAFNLPMVVNYCVNTNSFRKYYYMVSKELHYLGKYLICKKLAKTINKISIVYLHQNPRLSGEELVERLPEISVHRLLGFCGASFMATLLFYFELDGIKFYTILVRQYYFSEYLSLTRSHGKDKSHRNGKWPRQLSHKDYVFEIIKNRDWEKFTDPYTLNRLLKLYLELNKSVNGGLFRGESNLMNHLQHSFGRLITTVSISSLGNFHPALGLPFYLADSVIDLGRSMSNSVRNDALTFAKVTGDVSQSHTNNWDQRRFNYSYFAYIYVVFVIRVIVMGIYYLLATISDEDILMIFLLELGYQLFGNIYFCKVVEDLFKIIRNQLR